MQTPPLSSVALPDRYRVTGFLAAGGMAGVWSAHDELLGRAVAIKVLAEHLSSDADAARRFQREARAAAGLSSHPHVVTIYDVGEHEGRAFIVMELLPGGTVADRLAEGRVDRGLALRWVGEAGSALDAAHVDGVVHRDIKPANLLLDERDRLAVADFGIARLVHDADHHTATGIVLGTAAYLAPEQAMGEETTDASDRYALAVVAFELLCGRRPFQAEHFAAQARQHIEVPPPDASAVAPDLPAAVDGVLQRALAKDPRERWSSCAAFVGALSAALEGRGAAAQPPTAVTAVAPPAPPLPPRATAVPARRREPRRPRSTWLLPALVLAALLLAGGAIAAIVTGGGDNGNPTRTSTSKNRAQASPTSEATREPAASPEPTAAASPEPTASATPAPPSGGGKGNPTALNNEGYALYQQGKYAEAIPLLTRAVERCGSSSALDPCGYAYFNLGSALLQAGRPGDAIPLLEARLARWDFKAGEVKRQLRAARAAASGRSAKPRGNGNGKGNGKGGGGDED